LFGPKIPKQKPARGVDLTGMTWPKKKSSSAKIIAAMVFCSFAAFVFVVVIPNLIRARLTTASNACINNLRQIDGAKQQWALENRKQSNDIPTGAEISIYLGRDGKMPVCPQGGTYTMGRVDEDPTCSISASAWPNDHVLTPTNNSRWTDFKSAYGALLRPRHAPAQP
jgi:hypothetical protein